MSTKGIIEFNLELWKKEDNEGRKQILKDLDTQHIDILLDELSKREDEQSEKEQQQQREEQNWEPPKPLPVETDDEEDELPPVEIDNEEDESDISDVPHEVFESPPASPEVRKITDNICRVKTYTELVTITRPRPSCPVPTMNTMWSNGARFSGWNNWNNHSYPENSRWQSRSEWNSQNEETDAWQQLDNVQGTMDQEELDREDSLRSQEPQPMTCQDARTNDVPLENSISASISEFPNWTLEPLPTIQEIDEMIKELEKKHNDNLKRKANEEIEGSPTLKTPVLAERESNENSNFLFDCDTSYNNDYESELNPL